jgi:hypothetical protein
MSVSYSPISELYPKLEVHDLELTKVLLNDENKYKAWFERFEAHSEYKYRFLDFPIEKIFLGLDDNKINSLLLIQKEPQEVLQSLQDKYGTATWKGDVSADIGNGTMHYSMMSWSFSNVDLEYRLIMQDTCSIRIMDHETRKVELQKKSK